MLYVKSPTVGGGVCNVVFRGGAAGSDGGSVKLWLASDASHSTYIQGQHNGGGATSLIFGTAPNDSLPVERLRITSTGNVGIGTNPTYKCQIHCGEGGDVPTEGFALQMSGNYYLFNIYPYVVAGAQVGWRFRVKSVSGGDNTAIQISNTGSVYFPMGSSSASDSRIKKDIEDINDETALNKLLLIQPTTYNYIDVEWNKGFGIVYGFIAQQIREVIPEAVPIIEYIIPNIYKKCLINNKREVYHSIPLDTPIDTEVKIRGSEYKIKEIYEDYFVIDKDIEDVEAFVYGYNIKDFHTLDKTYIFTLNVCATQELHRRIEAQSVVIKSYEDRITDLEAKVAMLLSSNAT
jgi:hypothetical protein